MDMTRRQQTNVSAPDDAHAPVGQIVKLRAYPAVDNKGAAAPNADTLYTLAWLDVTRAHSNPHLHPIGGRPPRIDLGAVLSDSPSAQQDHGKGGDQQCHT